MPHAHARTRALLLAAGRARLTPQAAASPVQRPGVEQLHERRVGVIGVQQHWRAVASAGCGGARRVHRGIRQQLRRLLSAVTCGQATVARLIQLRPRLRTAVHATRQLTDVANHACHVPPAHTHHATRHERRNSMKLGAQARTRRGVEGRVQCVAHARCLPLVAKAHPLQRTPPLLSWQCPLARERARRCGR